MSLNFSAFEGKNIFKFAKYEIKEIGKTKYIVPDSGNNDDPLLRFLKRPRLTNSRSDQSFV